MSVIKRKAAVPAPGTLYSISLSGIHSVPGDSRDPKAGRCLIVLLWILGIVCLISILLPDHSSNTNSNATAGASSSATAAPSSRVIIPLDESQFIRIVSDAKSASVTAENDMQRGGFKARRDDQVCNVLTSKTIIDWVGTVRTVDSNSDGKGVLSIAIADGIRLETWNNDLSDFEDHTLLQPSTKVFNAAASMRSGQLATFSGSFIPDSENCIRESSMTLSGKLTDPEFIFQFSAVAPYVEPTQQPVQPVAVEPEPSAAPAMQESLVPADSEIKIPTSSDPGAMESK